MQFKRYRLMELCGAILCLAGVWLLSNLYELTNRNAVGIIFGSVNGSVWESLKPVMLTYFAYGGLELLSAKPYFRAFVVAKSFGLCFVMALYLGLRCFMSSIIVSAFLALAPGFAFSYILMKKELSDFFALGCFLLLTVFMMYFCFTANPPGLEIFRDPVTGLYGIIPQDFDRGAVFLSAVF